MSGSDIFLYNVPSGNDVVLRDPTAADSGSATTLSGDGLSSGVGTGDAIGDAIWAVSAQGDGVSAPTAVAQAVWAVVGRSDGAASSSGAAGDAIWAVPATSTGNASGSAVGDAIWAVPATSNGSASASNAVADAIWAVPATSNGSASSSSAVGDALWAVAATANGSAAGSAAVADALWAVPAHSDGQALADAVSNTIVAAVARSDGAASGNAAGADAAAPTEAVARADGVSTADAQCVAIWEAVARSDGVSAPSAAGAMVIPAVAQSDGAATADAVGRDASQPDIIEAVAESHGTSDGIAVGENIGQVQASGGVGPGSARFQNTGKRRRAQQADTVVEKVARELAPQRARVVVLPAVARADGSATGHAQGQTLRLATVIPLGAQPALEQAPAAQAVKLSRAARKQQQKLAARGIETDQGIAPVRKLAAPGGAPQSAPLIVEAAAFGAGSARCEAVADPVSRPAKLKLVPRAPVSVPAPVLVETEAGELAKVISAAAQADGSAFCSAIAQTIRKTAEELANDELNFIFALAAA
jgi:hypothetical protein